MIRVAFLRVGNAGRSCPSHDVEPPSAYRENGIDADHVTATDSLMPVRVVPYERA